MKDGYCDNCPNQIDCYQTGRCWPPVDKEKADGRLPEYFAGATNLAYIVIFLRNGGERLRAIWLAKSTLGISTKEATEWVDSVSLITAPVPELLPEIPPRKVELVKTASHWPPTVTERMKSKVQNANCPSVGVTE